METLTLTQNGNQFTSSGSQNELSLLAKAVATHGFFNMGKEDDEEEKKFALAIMAMIEEVCGHGLLNEDDVLECLDYFISNRIEGEWLQS